jgi:deazaflavin-dependent oxidoreductase (nitroreductase family)
MTEDRNEANRKVVEEFRAHGGKVGGFFEDKDLLIVHHVGARSGTRYETPLTYFGSAAGAWTVVAANGGRPNDPAWVHNLQAAPDVAIEVADGSGGVATVETRARFSEGEERRAILDDLAVHSQALAGMRERTTRVFPVVVFEPVAASA